MIVHPTHVKMEPIAATELMISSVLVWMDMVDNFVMKVSFFYEMWSYSS